MTDTPVIPHLDDTTPDIAARNLDRLADLFPDCVTEGPEGRAVDFDLLRQALSGQVVEGPDERYRLDWPGKRAAMALANRPTAKTLRPNRAESVDFDTTRNLFIEGDNLEALKILQETYLGRVKMIYIDPPYNTGKDFIYRDDFRRGVAEELEASGQADETGRLVANTEANGRFHSDWLSMIAPRLRLARTLLREDGVIAVSIGVDEVMNLFQLMREVFGEVNYVAFLTWEKGRKNDSTFYSESADYVIIFSRSREVLASLGNWRSLKVGFSEVTEEYARLVDEHENDHAKINFGMSQFYAKLNVDHPALALKHFKRSDDRGLYFGADISSASTSIPDYEIIHPRTKKPVKKPERGWGATEPVMLERISEGRVEFGYDETTIPLKKSYIQEVSTTVNTPVIYKDGRAASLEVKRLFKSAVFDNPKDRLVLADLVEYCASDCPNGIIMDFFAGSSSLPHAVITLNAKTEQWMRFVAVQYPEVIDEATASSPAARKTVKTAAKLLSQLNKPHTIAEISKERIRRAGAKILSDNPDLAGRLDVGFRAFRVDGSVERTVGKMPSETTQDDLLTMANPIRDDRSDEDLLFEAMLRRGVDITLPIKREMVLGREVFVVDPGGADDRAPLLACFARDVDADLAASLAAMRPLNILFRSDGFASDEAMANAHARICQTDDTITVRVL